MENQTVIELRSLRELERVRQTMHEIAKVANRVAGALINGEDLEDGDVQSLRFLAYEYLRDPSCKWRDASHD